MKRQKMIARVLVIIMLVAAILNMTRGIVRADDLVDATETSKTSTGKVVKWKYQLDENENIVNLICANTTTELSGSLTIPATIDGHKVIKLVKLVDGGLLTSGTFEGFTGLTEVKISEGITTIGSEAFKGCSGLTSVTIPNTVTSIGDYAFRNCTGLKSITLPENLTEISSSMFMYCSKLTEVKIPENVTTIRDEAFYYCESLEKILIPQNVATIGKNVFSYCSKNLTIYGAKGSKTEEFATENNIKFDTIENYSKGTGADITAPVVSSISVTNVSDFYSNDTQDYRVPSNYKMNIQVEFNENLKGDKAPTLTIKIGDVKEISLTSIALSGKRALYEYTTTSSDLGTVKAVKLEGGNLTDEAGNAVELSVKDINDSKIYVDNQKGNTENDDKNNTNIPSDAVKYNGHYYYIYEDVLTWEEAKKYCESKGGHLVTITSKEEQEFIEKYINDKGYGKVRFWIGATDKEKEGEWKWVTGEPFEYSNWGKKVPDNNLDNQDFALICNYENNTYGIKKGQWDDIDNESISDVKTYFICEFDNYSQDNKNQESNKLPETSDNTTATGKIPQTGQNLIIGGVIFAIAIFAIVQFKINKKYKDIK